MIIYISIEKVQANPWQTRLAEPDPEYIKELAQDIAVNGLLQTPMGRIMNSADQAAYFAGPPDERKIMDLLGLADRFVQLAFGHNRLAAYKLLADQDLHESILTTGDYTLMPVDIRQLDDEQMAEFAWSENEKRRDVTPIERARAIERRMADFGWSLTDVSANLGLARPTVSNILRLLKLPEEIQQAIAEERITERAASALLPMYELPEHVRQLADKDYWLSPKEALRKALNGESSDSIRDYVKRMLDYWTKQLQKAEFGLDELFKEGFVEGDDAGGSVYCGLCRTCDRREKHEGNICYDIVCFKAKTALHRRSYLARASAACGIPAVDPNKGGSITSLPYHDETAAQILATKCENLRLMYAFGTDNNNPCRVDGYPHALIICDKRNNSCSCAQGLALAGRAAPKSAVQIEDEDRENDPSYEGVLSYHPEDDEDDDELDLTEDDIEAGYEYARQQEPVRAQTPTPTALTADELAEIARKARSDKRDVPGELETLKERLIDLAAGWLKNEEPGAWYLVVNSFLWPRPNELDMDKIRSRAASYLVNKLFSSDYSNVDEIYEQLNRNLDRLHLPRVERERTLVEVFEGGEDA